MGVLGAFGTLSWYSLVLSWRVLWSASRWARAEFSAWNSAVPSGARDGCAGGFRDVCAHPSAGRFWGLVRIFKHECGQTVLQWGIFHASARALDLGRLIK